MYSRTLRSLLNVATLLRSDVSAKSAAPFISLSNSIADKPPPCATYYCCQRKCSDAAVQYYEDFHNLNAIERKDRIDEIAQMKIDQKMAEDPSLIDFKKILELEIDVLRQSGCLLPQVMRPRDWLPLLGMKSKQARRRYFTFLFKREMKKFNEAQERKARHDGLEMARAERKAQVETGEIQYGFHANFLLRRINEAAINHLYNWNSLRAHLFGNKVVFDCSYEKYMNSKEISSCARQIVESYHVNRAHNHPVHAFLCNLDPNGLIAERLLRCLPMLYTEDFPWTVTKESFLDIFDHSQLYYLSPHAANMIEEYDANSVYIIGAYVDKGDNYPISMSIAKEHNLRMGKLPLDKYVRFGSGSQKNLTLNQVMGILLYAQTGDWKQGMDLFIPKRKLFESRMRYLEAKVLRDRLRRQNISQDEIKEQIRSLYEPSQEIEEKFGIAASLKLQQRRRRQVLRDCVDHYNKDAAPQKQPIFTYDSGLLSEHDFSNAARVKLREQWNK